MKKLLRSRPVFGVEFRASLFAGRLMDAYLTRGYGQAISREDASHIYSPCPFWTRPLLHVGLFNITTIQP
jgi:hypothetical protein